MPNIVDNRNVAIMTKVNALAERYGLKTYDFLATVRSESESENPILTFEIPVQGDTRKEMQYEKMLTAIGVGPENGVLQGSDAKIIDALDAALHTAPKMRR